MLRASRPLNLLPKTYRSMCVNLEAIHFNHDPTSNTTGAFSIRRNEKCSIRQPEWRRHISVRPEDAPAAYAYERVKKLKEITIKAEFSCDAADPPRFVRALDGHGYRGNVLGTAVSREIKFDRGKCVATLVLSNVRILDLGVGVGDVIWNWQYSHNGEEWVDFATSLHRIYTVVDMPNAPWQPATTDIDNTQLPWTEVLDFACRAAAATTHVDDAATRITQWTNSLGSGFIHYDDQDGWTGFTFDDPPRFDCSEFLLLLNGGKNLQGPMVNCDDCAAVVTSFSNILGCKLREGEMGKASFVLNPHFKIGVTNVQPGGRFSRHNVGWLRDGKETDPLFDACVRLDFQKGPGETWIVPTNIPFNEYRPFLSNDADTCVPTGKLPIRTIGLSLPGRRHETPETSAALESSEPVSRSVTISDVATLSSTLSQTNQFQDLKLIDFRLVHTTLAKYLLQVFCRHKKEEGVSFGINIYECDSFDAIRTLVDKILSRFNLSPEEKEPPPFGTETYASDNWFLILFVRDSFVFLIRNTGRRKVSCAELAKKIDDVANEIRRNILKEDRMMAQHKFDGKWTVIESNGLVPVVSNEKMVLVIPANGDVDKNNSKHKNMKLGGKATDTTLDLDGEEPGNKRTFKGRAREFTVNGRLFTVVVGEFKDVTREKDDIAEAQQNEGVWILTKP